MGPEHSQGFILDVDGTLIEGTRPAEGGRLLPGARELVDWLRHESIPFVCFTNGTGLTPRAYALAIREHGLEMSEEEWMTPATVAAAYIGRRWPNQSVLALGGPGLTEPLRDRGIQLLDSMSEWRLASVVCVGWDRALSYERLESACRAVWNGAVFLVTSDAPTFHLLGDRGIGLSAAIAAAITKVTKRRPILLGKPSRLALSAACDRLRRTPAEVTVVGDDIDVEVKMGVRFGCHTVFVESGLSGKIDWSKTRDSGRPDLIVPNLLGLVDRLREPMA